MKAADILRNRLGSNMRESVGVVVGAAPQAPAEARAFPGGTDPRSQGVARIRDALSIDLSRLVPDPDQPRRDFEPTALADLAASIAERGVLQPLLVRWDGQGDRWVVLAGERRYRASIMAGLSSVPCIEFKGELDAAGRLEIQMIENALRVDLLPMEQARAYRALLDQRGWSYRELAARLHVGLASVSRTLALLDLPDDVQHQVDAGTLAPRTAYELSRAEDADTIRELAAEVTTAGLSRDETVKAVRSRKPTSKAAKGRGSKPIKNRVIRTPSARVTVDLRKAGGAGSILAALREAVAMLEGEQGAEAA
jgi:ParB family chromosome partitioning protein